MKKLGSWLIAIILIASSTFNVSASQQEEYNTNIDQEKCRIIFEKNGIDIPDDAVFAECCVIEKESGNKYRTICMLEREIDEEYNTSKASFTGLLSIDEKDGQFSLIEVDELLASSYPDSGSSTANNVTFTASWLYYYHNQYYFRPKSVAFQYNNTNSYNVTTLYYTCGTRYNTSYTLIGNDLSYSLTKSATPAYYGNTYRKTDLSPFLYRFYGSYFLYHYCECTIGSVTYTINLPQDYY